ncbi:MAG: tyrosine--tRNA ligase [Clostridiales Family XIII bacterium]|jgi:tyrosyl-tRNA synthetase|nr:tyrosine--tRNA ligase [Clostridiales Family XIII bacterium]
MAKNVYDVLLERGFIRQTTHEAEIRKLLDEEKTTFYIGFDPTADSLHVGHFMQVIIMMWMQKYGHTPIVLVGGGTTMVGDPSGRTDMRQMMTRGTIFENGKRFVKLFERFLEFGDIGPDGRPAEPGKAILVNNADWLLDLNYVDFIRDIGRHFSVNNMLRAECFRSRMEKGLSFLEFNYMLMQSYDFLELYRRHGCKMQFGGDDQWSNILGGVDLIRREAGGQAYGMTFALLTTSEGKKMGKTQAGALWLDAEKTSPYDFYQYWRNVEDADVRTCLSMLTFLPMEEVEALSSLQGSGINRAKERLAFEVTKLVHGEADAARAQDAARALFGAPCAGAGLGGAGGSDGVGGMENVPTSELDRGRLAGEGLGLVTLLREVGLVQSNGEGFRAIQQGGLVIGGEKVADPKKTLTEADFTDGKMLIKKGKKTYHLVVLA